MYGETIFREKDSTGEYLYWYSIQGEGGLDVEHSEHEKDQKHLAFWYECIDQEIKIAPIKTEGS